MREETDATIAGFNESHVIVGNDKGKGYEKRLYHNRPVGKATFDQTFLGIYDRGFEGFQSTSDLLKSKFINSDYHKGIFN